MKIARALAPAFTLALALGVVTGARPALADSGSGTQAGAVQAGAVQAGAMQAGAEVVVGKPAPELNVKASDGTALKSSALKGKWVVVYFYPKDETPGCTKEACAFRDAWSELAKRGVVLVGVSADSDESHRKFAEHHKLPFHLVADEKGELAKAFGVPAYGRQTFVIGKDGTVKKVYRSVDVSKHAQEILDDTK